MYTIYIGEKLFYRIGVEDLALHEFMIDFELNQSSLMDFIMPPKHPYYDEVNKLSTYLDLYRSGVHIGRYRVLNTVRDFHQMKKVECEGMLSFFLDTIQRPYEYTGGISGLLKHFLDVHNSQVEPVKQFMLGKVTVIDNNDYVNRSSGKYLDTLKSLDEKLVSTHGGYLHVRYEKGVNYLDYLSDYGVISNQTIRFGENLIDLNHCINADEVKTAIIPQGAELEEEGINGVKLRTDITSVNEGVDYLYSEEAVNIFGWIWGTIEFDDVTIPDNLKRKGKAYLEDCINLQVSIEITAIDAKYLGLNVRHLNVGDWVKVISLPHKLDKYFMVAKQVLHPENPEQDTLTLGVVLDGFTVNTSKKDRDLSLKLQETASNAFKDLNDRIEKATELITGGRGGYVFTVLSEDGHPEEMLFMDTPNIETSVNILRINKNGIGFSRSGINGPYGNAWTIDGALNADFLTAGVIRGLQIFGADIISNTSGYKALQIQNGIIKFYDWFSSNHTFISLIAPAAFTTLGGQASTLFKHTKDSSFVFSHQNHNNENDNSGAGTYLKFDKYGSSAPITFYERTLFENALVVKGGHTTYGVGSGDWQFNALGSTITFFAGGTSRFRVGAGTSTVWGALQVTGGLTVSGSKNRAVVTENFGTIALNAVESTDCLFEDNGSAKLNKKGECYIFFDEIFKETITTKVNYYVQLTKLGLGDIYVKEKHQDYFVVKGTRGLRFDWNVKAKQKGYEVDRLQRLDKTEIKNDAEHANEMVMQNVDRKDDQYTNFYEEYLKGLIEGGQEQ